MKLYAQGAETPYKNMGIAKKTGAPLEIVVGEIMLIIASPVKNKWIAKLPESQKINLM